MRIIKIDERLCYRKPTQHLEKTHKMNQQIEVNQMQVRKLKIKTTTFFSAYRGLGVKYTYIIYLRESIYQKILTFITSLI